jgi:hypothetical protein
MTLQLCRFVVHVPAEHTALHFTERRRNLLERDLLFALSDHHFIGAAHLHLRAADQCG